MKALAGMRMPSQACHAGLHAVPEAPEGFPGPGLGDREPARASDASEPLEQEDWLLEFDRSQLGSCDDMRLHELVRWALSAQAGSHRSIHSCPMAQDHAGDLVDGDFLAALLDITGDGEAAGLLRHNTI